MHLPCELQRILRRGLDMGDGLRRVNAHRERELARLTGCDPNDEHLIRKRDEGFTPERDRTNLVRRFCGRVVQVEVAAIRRRFRMTGEV